MNKKAFVLMETIVVIVVISVALLTIFASYSKILTKVKKENKYDTSEYIYMTKYVRDYLKEKECTKFDDGTGTKIENVYEMGKDNISRRKELINYYNVTACGFGSDNPFNIKGIYLLQYLNEVDEDESNKDLYKFDANMIDYIRKLDVGSNDTILVVEYDRVALDDEGNAIYETSCPEGKNDLNENLCKPLTETYIASLEW